jgi:hypothetical protein
MRDEGAQGAACKNWEKKICDGTSAQSAACLQAKGVVELLPSTACDAALGKMPETLAKIKLERAVCDDLVKKLCGDLESGSATCSMVKERSESFPPDRCKEMLSNYDEVIGQLKRMDQMQGAQGRPGMQGHPGMQGNPGMKGHPGMQGGPQSAPPPGP